MSSFIFEASAVAKNLEEHSENLGQYLKLCINEIKAGAKARSIPVKYRHTVESPWYVLRVNTGIITMCGIAHNQEYNAYSVNTRKIKTDKYFSHDGNEWLIDPSEVPREDINDIVVIMEYLHMFLEFELERLLEEGVIGVPQKSSKPSAKKVTKPSVEASADTKAPPKIMLEMSNPCIDNPIKQIAKVSGATIINPILRMKLTPNNSYGFYLKKFIDESEDDIYASELAKFNEKYPDDKFTLTKDNISRMIPSGTSFRASVNLGGIMITGKEISIYKYVDQLGICRNENQIPTTDISCRPKEPEYD